jgi:uncharacterized membrane protein (DUF106 family)
MSFLNSVLRVLIDTLQAPLAGADPVVGIALWSIPTGVFALLVFKWTSNQQRIAEVKRRIHACLFEIRLFNDDLRAILRAQGEILRHVLHYQGLALKPMIWILPPLVLLMVHLHGFYGFRGFEPGDSALLQVELNDGWQNTAAGGRPDLRLEVPPGLRLETPAMWVPALGEVNWRIASDDWGDYVLRFSVGQGDVSKSVRVTDRVVRLSPIRPSTNLIDQLEWPSELPLAASSPIRSISVAYPDQSVLGWEWRYAWMVVFFALTMVIAVALKNRFGVEL